jgi:hypothetical protein
LNRNALGLSRREVRGRLTPLESVARLSDDPSIELPAAATRRVRSNSAEDRGAANALIGAEWFSDFTALAEEVRECPRRDGYRARSADIRFIQKR